MALGDVAHERDHLPRRTQGDPDLVLAFASAEQKLRAEGLGLPRAQRLLQVVAGLLGDLHRQQLDHFAPNEIFGESGAVRFRRRMALDNDTVRADDKKPVAYDVEESAKNRFAPN